MQRTEEIPVIDIGPLRHATNETEFQEAVEDVGAKIDKVCRNVGFFYITNHGVSEELQNTMDSLAHSFFSLPLDEKNKIAMIHGGKAWRGFFAVGDEVTSGIPDQKEGIYFGTEIPDGQDPRPLHGPNLWPDGELGERMKESVLSYLSHMKSLGQLLMKTIAHALHLNKEQFGHQFINPTELFRIFNYPPHHPKFGENSLGVGEHTDYGYLTILKQDPCGGLQVKEVTSGQWIDAPFIPNSFVVNLGDALEHNTQGLYKATPHRVLQRKNATSNRISMPYFFDPSFDTPLQSMVPYMTETDKRIVAERAEREKGTTAATRWDRLDPTIFQGTYGEYLMKKISKAFPELFKQQGLDSGSGDCGVDCGTSMETELDTSKGTKGGMY